MGKSVADFTIFDRILIKFLEIFTKTQTKNVVSGFKRRRQWQN